MRRVKIIIKSTLILTITALSFLSCNDDNASIGYGLLNQGEASGLRKYLKVIAYNLYNGDSIRSDEAVLQGATVGAYTEGIFGKIKASYVTQIRLGAPSPIFSDSIVNGLPLAKVDSAVLYFTPSFSTGSTVIKVDTVYTDANGARYDKNLTDKVDTFRIITKYPISSKYGNHASKMTLSVNTINEYLYSIDSTYYSNKSITNSDFLGSAAISNFMVGVSFKNTNSKDLDSINHQKVYNISPSIRIPLSTSFFQTNIINKQGNIVLNDQSRFTRYLKGVKISTVEDDAFMINLSPNDIRISLYLTYTNKKNASGTVSKGNSVYNFSINNPYNVKLGLFERNASLSTYLSPFVGNSNASTGDSQLFLDGLGGFKNIVKIDQAQIDSLKTVFKNSGKSIVGAKLKFYKDPISVNLENPTTIFAYKYKNNGTLPVLISQVDYNKFAFVEDMSFFSQALGYSFNPVYDSEKKYYELNLTAYVKNIVEKDSLNYPLIVEMGNFYQTSTGSIVNVWTTTKPYNPYRMVFKGSNLPNDPERLRLQILYTEK